MRIAVITGTTRDGRVTPRLAAWVMSAATKQAEAEFVALDLKDFDIPMLNEAPWLPDRSLTDGARQWLDQLDQADGYVVVTGEYNHTVPAVLKNALDYTNGQIARKPVAIVSHGSVQGVRANEHLRQIVNSNAGAFPISATVTFYGQVGEVLNESGEAQGDNSLNDEKLSSMLDDIVWYAGAMKTAREQ